MDIEYVRKALVEQGWEKVQPGEHLGIKFDLVGERKKSMTHWNMLVKVLPTFDAATSEEWTKSFQFISKKSKSLWMGKCFVLCLVADQVAPDVAKAMQGDSFAMYHGVRMEGGGGTVLIADMQSKRVFGRVPNLPVDVYKLTMAAAEMLKQAIA
jgi:hypothetical protein